MDIRQTLINVIDTLNTIPVSGKKNLDSMVASITAIEVVLKAIDEAISKSSEKEEDAK